MDINQNSDHYRFLKKCYLVLYNQLNDKMSIILKKFREESYELINSEISLEDNAATYAISRRIADEFKGILSLENLNRISNGESIPKESLCFDAKWFEIWDNQSYNDWLDILTSESDKIYQYDHEDYRIYYKEIEFKDIQSLNSNIRELKLEFQFQIFDYDDLIQDKFNEQINQETIKIMKQIDHNSFIRESKRIELEGLIQYFIILSNKEPSNNKRDQVGFFHFPALFQGHYKRKNEKWLLVNSGDLKFPSKEILEKTKAIIIPGSHLNIYSDYEFLRKTEEFMLEVHNNYPNIKVLGICFGEHLIISAHKGKVDQSEKKKSDPNYFIFGPETISLTDSFWEIPFIKKTGLEKKKKLNLYQVHGDEVVEYPNYFRNYGISGTCENEILISDDFRYFLIQGHPEYSLDFNVTRSSAYLAKINGIYDEEGLNKFKKEQFEYQNTKTLDITLWRDMCFSFLKY